VSGSGGSRSAAPAVSTPSPAELELADVAWTSCSSAMTSAPHRGICTQHTIGRRTGYRLVERLLERVAEVDADGRSTPSCSRWKCHWPSPELRPPLFRRSASPFPLPFPPRSFRLEAPARAPTSATGGHVVMALLCIPRQLRPARRERLVPQDAAATGTGTARLRVCECCSPS
jgi:hypothetical protein